MGICRLLLLFPFATKPSESRLFPDEMRWVAAGCGRSQVSAQCTHPSHTAAVRCCKAEPGPTSCVSVCDVAQYSGLHSAPVLDGLDGFAASLTEAEAECNSRRMRLCTRAELASNVCCQTGCVMDKLLVWTADDCPATACRKQACSPSTLPLRCSVPPPPQSLTPPPPPTTTMTTRRTTRPSIHTSPHAESLSVATLQRRAYQQQKHPRVVTAATASTVPMPLCKRDQHVEGEWRLSPLSGPRWPCCGYQHVQYHGIAESSEAHWLNLFQSCRGREPMFQRTTRSGSWYGAFCCKKPPDQAVWVPQTCALLEWDPHGFCKTLGSRRLLVIGDSTMTQTAVALMNALAFSCWTQVTYGISDLLTNETGKGVGRGSTWHKLVKLHNPDIVLLSAGAHIKTEARFRSILAEVSCQARRLFPQKLIIWKTQNPAGCGPRILRRENGPGKEMRATTASHSKYQTDWANFLLWDEIAAQFFRQEGTAAVLDVSPLYLRVDAHPGSYAPGDCLHFCSDATSPLTLIPVLLHHLLLDEESSANRTVRV